MALRRRHLLQLAALSLAAPARADEAAARALPPCTLGFARTAPFVVVTEEVLPAPPARVFATLAAPAPWPLWLPVVQEVVYRGPPPFGVGSERDVTTSFGVIGERFLAWEEGQRFAFYVHGTTSPVLQRFFEDYRLRPVAGGATRLTWTVAFEMVPWAVPLGPFLVASAQAVAGRALPALGRLLASGS